MAIVPKTEEVMAFPSSVEEYCQIKEAQTKEVDIATGLDTSMTDEELLTLKLKELEDRVDPGLSPEEKAKIIAVFRKYSKCWLKPAAGEFKLTKARFEVIGRPVKDKMRPLDSAMREELDRQIDSQLKAGVIRPAHGPWGSVPVFVRKKDGGWRVAIDYRGVNRQLKADAYPLPLIWENLQHVSGHKFYTCLDGMWGFWNVPLEERSKEVTAILTHRGAFEYNVIPFGICNSPGEFQRAMDALLSDLYYQGVLCYIDDIVIYSNTLEEHLLKIEEVLKRCSAQGLYLKVSKSQIAWKEVPLLGHLVGEKGIRPNPNKVAALRASTKPKNKAELMSFLGSAGYLRRFVPHYSDLSQPLTDLCGKKARWKWTEEHDQCFRSLRDALCDHVLLSAPRGEGRFIIMCDASEVALGSVLCQEQNGEVVVLEFASRKFNKTEKNWPVREKEAYAIRWSVEHFEPYIRGLEVLILTDHASLQWMGNAKTGKICRWALYLQQFSLEIRSIDGKSNVMADWLSRSVPGAEDEEIEEICVPIYCLGKERPLVQWYKGAPFVPSVDDFIEGSKTISDSDAKWCVKLSDGTYRSARSDKIFVPENLRESIMYWFHASRFGGHMGVTRTVRRMAKWVFWPGMKNDVAKYIDACLVCKRAGVPHVPYLRDALMATVPFQTISLDHVGDRDWNGRTVRYLVIVDHASRFMVARSVLSYGSEEVISVLKNCWISIFGSPEVVVVDQGTAFTSDKFRSFMLQDQNAMIVYSSARYPQGNGINEASHRGLEAALRACVQLDGSIMFEDALYDAVLAYNCTPHLELGESPGCFIFGMEISLPGWQRHTEKLSAMTRLAKMHDMRARKMMQEVLRSQEHLQLVNASELKVGEWVVYWLTPRERRQDLADGTGLAKYTAEWSMPVRVIEIKNRAVIVAERDEGGIPRQVPLRHVRRLASSKPLSLEAVHQQVYMRESARFRRVPEWAPCRSKRARTNDVEVMIE